tara:strand:- start:86 stop:319 length:234 start_codon:yes stop_codon:yes gene_type:complete
MKLYKNLQAHQAFLFSNGLINNIKDGNNVSTEIIANNMAKPVKIPKYMVGINLDKTKIEKPKTIVIEVFKIAFPTVE